MCKPGLSPFDQPRTVWQKSHDLDNPLCRLSLVHTHLIDNQYHPLHDVRFRVLAFPPLYLPSYPRSNGSILGEDVRSEDKPTRHFGITVIEEDLCMARVQISSPRKAMEEEAKRESKQTLSPNFIFSFMIFLASWLRTPENKASLRPSGMHVSKWSRQWNRHTIPRGLSVGSFCSAHETQNTRSKGKNRRTPVSRNRRSRTGGLTRYLANDDMEMGHGGRVTSEESRSDSPWHLYLFLFLNLVLLSLTMASWTTLSLSLFLL